MPLFHQLTLEDSRERVPLPRFGGDDRERPAAAAAAAAFDRVPGALHDPRRWGLSAAAMGTWGERLDAFWHRCRGGFKTCTRATSGRADDYLRGQLPRDGARHLAHRARHMTGDDGPALPHFLATAPWLGPAVFEQMPAASTAPPALASGSPLILAERADEKAGRHQAGAARQDHGRLGKVDGCRVDTCLTYAHGGLWAMVDGEGFLPEEWWGAACAPTRHALGLPPDRTCETQLQWGGKMGQRVKAKGGPCDLWAWDALDGRDSPLRAAWAAENGQDAAQVPAETAGSRRAPRVGLPPKRGTRGRRRTRLRGLRGQRPQAGRALAQHPQTGWERVQGRLTARGWWPADFAVPRVWPGATGQRPRAAWWVIRRQSAGDGASTRLNAPPDTPPAGLIAWSCRRYFPERTLEDAKTEMGWAAFQAQKYRAWEHPWALTAAALWCVAPTK
jgi:hypothetical protein